MSKLNLIAPDSPEAALSRRSLVQTLAGTALAMTVLAGCGGSDATTGGSANASGRAPTTSQYDVAILQFALHLEYLEAEFYSYAVNGSGISGNVAVSGQGTAGETTGGVATNFTSSDGRRVATEIARDELDHVRVLRGALSGGVIAKPAIDLATVPAALGLDLTTETGFLTLARAFEDVGVTAYIGGSPYLSDAVLRVAGRILAVEAFHTGNIRLQALQLDAPGGPAQDGKDQPTTTTDPLTGQPQNFFATDAQGLSFARTPTEVLRIVLNQPSASSSAIAANPRGGFFPSGLNLTGNNASLLLDITS